MHSIETTVEAIQSRLGELRPDLQVKIRRPLTGGLSGADIHLVDFIRDNEWRLGVLKVAPALRGEHEARGIAAARDSWLNDYLPDYIEVLPLIDDKQTAILSGLARDRLEDCCTLEDLLKTSFPYASEHILFA